MKTTLVIDDSILRRLKQEAGRQRKTVSALVEAALRRMLEEKKARKTLSPLPGFDGGGVLVDVADRDALYRTMEGR